MLESENILFAVNSDPARRAGQRAGRVFAYNIETKALAPEFTFALADENIRNIPTGLWGDSRCLYVGAELNGYVYCYLIGSGTSRGLVCALAQRNASPRGVWSDADYHFVNDEVTRHVYVYNQDDCQIALSDDMEDFMSSAVWLGLIAFDSPISGAHLFGVAQDVWFHYNPGPPHNDTAILTTGKFTTYAEEQLSGPVKLATDQRYIFIVTPISIKIFDVLERKILEDVDLPRASNLSTILRDEDWVTAAWSDGYFLVGTRAGEVFHSNLRTLQFDQLDFARTEAYPDSLISIEVYNRQIILFGSASIEQWFNSGDTPVFRRNHSFSVNIGAASQAAIAVDLTGIFFLGTNGIVYHYAGTGGLRRVSTSAVEESIKRSDKALATAYTYTEEGQRFYILTLALPNNVKKTWALHIDTRLWHERTITNVSAFAEFQGEHLVSRPSGLDRMSVDLGSDHGLAIARQAVMPAVQANRSRFSIHALEIEVPYRDGGSIQDSVALDWSYDGGETFQPAISQPFPASDINRLKWTRLGGGDRSRNLRLAFNGIRVIDVLGAYIDMDVGEQ